MNKSNNDNIKEEKTQLTNNANRLAEKDLEHISELTGQDWEAVSGEGIPLLALAAGRIIIPAVGGFIAKEIIKNEGTNFFENESIGVAPEGRGDILL